MSQSKYALEQGNEDAGLATAAKRSRTDAPVKELPASHDAVLPLRDLTDHDRRLPLSHEPQSRG